MTSFNKLLFRRKDRLLTGFTLMEILVYIAVLAVIISAVLVFLSWAIKSNNKVRVMAEVSDNANRAMESMIYEIREAKSIYLPTSTSTQLSLETGHSLPAGETSAFIDFFLCGAEKTALCLKKESEDAMAITSDRVEISYLEFLQIATTTPSIQVSLGIDYKNPQGRPEYQASINVTSTVSLRSY